jgi:hypothetical protein
MVDVVTSQLIENGRRNWAYVFTSISDGTGETGVVKVDGSAAGPLGIFLYGQNFYPLSHIKIVEVEFNVKGMGLEIIWDATMPQNALYIGSDTAGRQNYHKIGGLAAASAGTIITGATGKIKFTTVSALPNGGYTVYMRGTKGIPQS